MAKPALQILNLLLSNQLLGNYETDFIVSSSTVEILFLKTSRKNNFEIDPVVFLIQNSSQKIPQILSIQSSLVFDLLLQSFAEMENLADLPLQLIQRSAVRIDEAKGVALLELLGQNLPQRRTALFVTDQDDLFFLNSLKISQILLIQEINETFKRIVHDLQEELLIIFLLNEKLQIAQGKTLRFFISARLEDFDHRCLISLEFLAKLLPLVAIESLYFERVFKSLKKLQKRPMDKTQLFVIVSVEKNHPRRVPPLKANMVLFLENSNLARN